MTAMHYFLKLTIPVLDVTATTISELVGVQITCAQRTSLCHYRKHFWFVLCSIMHACSLCTCIHVCVCVLSQCMAACLVLVRLIVGGEHMYMAAHTLLQSLLMLVRVLEETQTMVAKNRLMLQQRGVDVDTMLSLVVPLDSLGILLDSDSMTAMSNQV
ncbi:TPA: hypothetical protein ACH3X2_002891 [Trebouxia sp. C0005]